MFVLLNIGSSPRFFNDGGQRGRRKKKKAFRVLSTYPATIYNTNKEVFVKHEQAPTAPKLEGVRVFVDFKYIFYENRYFWPIIQLLVGCF